MSMSSFPWIAECVGTQGDPSNPVDLYEPNNGYRRIAENLTEEDAALIIACVDAVATWRWFEIHGADHAKDATDRMREATALIPAWFLDRSHRLHAELLHLRENTGEGA